MVVLSLLKGDMDVHGMVKEITMKNKRRYKILSLILCCILAITLLSEKSSGVCAQTADNQIYTKFTQEESGDRYIAPFGDIASVTLVSKNPGYSVVTYEIYINFSVNQNFYAVRVNSFSLTNGNLLNPVTYMTLTNGYYTIQGTPSLQPVKIGEIVLPSTVTSLYANVNGVYVYFYTEDMSVGNYNGAVHFN